MLSLARLALGGVIAALGACGGDDAPAGRPDGGAACDDIGEHADPACDACGKASCCEQIRACDLECADTVACVFSCFGDGACEVDCRADAPASYTSMRTCLASACPPQCGA